MAPSDTPLSSETPLSSARADFIAGLGHMLPVILAAIPFALIFGALAGDRGLPVSGVALMSATVFAGGSQVVALGMWSDPPALLAIAATTLLVNARHLFMSASISRRMDGYSPAGRVAALVLLTDETWALAESRAARAPLTPAYYFGLALPLYVNWLFWTTLGAVIGALVDDPHALGLDFAFAAIFIGLLMGFRAAPGFVLVAGSSLIASAATAWLVPGAWSIAVGAAAGVATAALIARPEEGAP